MEQMPHHREGIQNDLDKAYDEAHRDNKAFEEAQVKSEGETHISDEEIQSQFSAEEKVAIGGEKGASLNLEEVKARFAPFITETLTEWYGKKIAEQVEQKPIIVALKDIDWEKLKDEVAPDKFGEYTLNPEMLNFDFKSAAPLNKMRVLQRELEEMKGKSFAEVSEYVIEKYSATHYIPGVEYWSYVFSNSGVIGIFADKVRRGANNILFMGSVIYSKEGKAGIPSTSYSPTMGLTESAKFLDNEWDSQSIVLLEK